MDRSLEIWRRLGLSQLKLSEPWFGIELGYWSQELREDAERAVRGEYLETGKKLSKEGRSAS